MKKDILIVLFTHILSTIVAFLLWLCIVYGVIYCLDIAFHFGVTFSLVFGIASAIFIVDYLFKIKKNFAICVEMYEKLTMARDKNGR